MPTRIHRVIVLVGTLGLVVAEPFARSMAADDEAISVAKPRLDFYGDALPEGVVSRLGTARLRHASSVNSVAFSADGLTLASCGQDSTVRLWDAKTGKERWRIKADVDYTSSVRFCGRLLLVETQKTVEDGPEKERRPGPKHVSTESVMALLDPATGKPIAEGRGYPEGTAFSPDGTWIACRSGQNKIVVREFPAGKVLRSFDIAKPVVEQLSFTTDGKALLVFQEKQVIRLDLQHGKETYRIPAEDLWFTRAMSPNGKLLAVCAGKTIRLWDSNTGKDLGKLDFELPAFAVDFERGSEKLLAMCSDRSEGMRISVWDIATRKKLRELKLDHFSSQVSFSPDGSRVAVGLTNENAIEIWDLATGKQVVDLKAPNSAPLHVVFSPNGKQLASSGDGYRVWDVNTGTTVWRKDFRWAKHIFFSPDGQAIIAPMPGNKSLVVNVWDARTGKVRKKIEMPDSDVVGGMALSPDGKTLATGYSVPWVFRRPRVHRLCLWDLDSGKQRKRFETSWPTSSLAFSPEGDLIAAGDDNMTFLINTHSGNTALPFPRKQSPGRALFSPCGILLVGIRAHEVIVWERGANEVMQTFAGDRAAFSHDGRILFIYDHNGDVRLREVIVGVVHEEIARFNVYKAGIRCLAPSPDGYLLAVGGDDTTILVWSLSHLLGLKEFESRSPEKLWADIGNEDSHIAVRAVWALSKKKDVVPFIESKLKIVVDETQQERFRALIRQLDDNQYQTRQAASAKLNSLAASEYELRQVLAGSPSLEARERIRKILAFQHRKRATGWPRAEIMQGLRAIYVLERVGDEESAKLLKVILKGSLDDRLRTAALSSLQRLRERK